MFFPHQPATMSKKEPTFRIVWITVGVRPLMMDTMVTNPDIDTVLAENRETDHVIEAKG